MGAESGVQSANQGRVTLSAEDVAGLNQRFRGAKPEAVLRWAIDTFGSRLALASSFGAEDMVLIDMLSRLEPPVTIFTLDTGRLHEETYDVMERTRERYKVAIESYFPGRDAVEALERERGFYSFRQSVEERKFCCFVRKVEPLGLALKTVDAWMTGLRREQAATRTGIDAVEIDASHGSILKINPLTDWTEPQVWAYIREHDVPYNALHDQGFPSIGCSPCTRAIKPGEDVRAGRWWWESPVTKECGLHLDSRQGDHGKRS